MQRPEDVFNRDKEFSDAACPHCESKDVEVLSLFGSTTSEILLRCKKCRSCFNWMKWRGDLPGSATVED